MFDAILIDFYGTISARDREAVEAACTRIVEAYGLPIAPHKFAAYWGERFFAVIERSNHDAFQTLFECELVSLSATLAEFQAHVGKSTHDLYPASFLSELDQYWANPPIHADAVEFLSSVDLPLCCVSNAESQPLAAAIERLGLRFDAVITSEAVRCYKPAPEIFQAAIQKLGVAPDRLLHIGDSLHSDVGGAARVGIKTVWICRDSRIHDIGNHKPDYTISTLTELGRIFRR